MNRNIENKINKYKKIQEKETQKYKEKMKNFKEIIEALEKYSEIKDTDSFETIVFKKYLELENVQSVAKYINDLGYRIKTDSYIGERRYKGTDITEILIKDADVEEKLKKVVQNLQDRNYSEMLKHWS